MYNPESLLVHEDFIRVLARHLLRDTNQADDVVQEAMLAAIQHPPKESGSKKSWFATVAMNIVRKSIRDDSRRINREKAVASREAVEATEKVLERESIRKQVVEAVLSLDDAYRVAIVSRFYDDLPPRKIAQQLDIPVETAKTRLKRGLVQLRQKLDARNSGDRMKWVMAIAPVAGLKMQSSATAAVGTGIITGVIDMCLKVKLGIYAALIIGACLPMVLWFLNDDKSHDEYEGANTELHSDPNTVATADEYPVNENQEIISLSTGNLTDNKPEKKRIPFEGAIETPLCRVFGEIVDEDGAPMKGVIVRLTSYGRPWREGKASSEGSTAKNSRGPAKTYSGQDGRFSIEATLPTSDWVSLSVKPGKYYSKAGRHFGIAGGRNKPPLHEGDNDLGRFILKSTGSVKGWVKTRNGSPLARAVVTVKDVHPEGGTLNAVTDANGRYLISHVPAMKCKLEVDKDGYITTCSDSCEIWKGYTTEPVDFFMDTALSLSGRVIDTEGRPLKGVYVLCLPINGTMASAKSDTEGAFTAYLPQNDAYTIKATLSGYLHRGLSPIDWSCKIMLWKMVNKGVSIEKMELPQGCYAPGTRDIEIVMEPLGKTILTCVDDETGKPIEDFALCINERRRESKGVYYSAKIYKIGPIKHHVKGEIEFCANPEKDSYGVKTPGYALASGPVVNGAITVRMKRGGRVKGKLQLDDAPAAHYSIKLERDMVKINHSLPDEAPDDRCWSDNYRYDIDEFKGQSRMETSDDQGCFLVENLSPGAWRILIEVQGPKKILKVVEGIKITNKEIHDLGVIKIRN